MFGHNRYTPEIGDPYVVVPIARLLGAANEWEILPGGIDRMNAFANEGYRVVAAVGPAVVMEKETPQ